MDENLLDNQEKKSNSEIKNSTEKEVVKVPKKQAVVFNPKNVALDDSKLRKKLDQQKIQAKKQTEKQIEKQKQQELEQEKQFSKTQKEEALLDKKQKQEQAKLQKLEKKEKIKLEKEQKKEQALLLKQSKHQAPKKDYGLNDLNELENRILNRKETEAIKRKRVIIILSIILIIMISIGSCTAKQIIDDQKPKPVEVQIEIITEGLEKTPIDPNNPDLGYVKHIVYPGDVIDVGFYVYNNQVTKSFPVYVRFRAYIILDELTEHSVFIPHFINESNWLTLTDENGEDLDIDDWYYYAGAIPVGIENKIQIIDQLKLRTDLDNKYQGKDFSLVLEIQAIEGSEEAATEIFEEWWLAPEDWYTHMEANDWYSHLINNGA